MKDYTLYNNDAFVVGILQTAIQEEDDIEITRIALLLPLLFDDKIVAKVCNIQVSYTIENLVMTNKVPLANYNDRYISVLPMLYRAIAMMLDVNAISMKSGKLVRRNMEILSRMIPESNSCRMNSMCVATRSLMKMTYSKDISKLYKMLNIEL